MFSISLPAPTSGQGFVALQSRHRVLFWDVKTYQKFISSISFWEACEGSLFCLLGLKHGNLNFSLMLCFKLCKYLHQQSCATYISTCLYRYCILWTCGFDSLMNVIFYITYSLFYNHTYKQKSRGYN